MSSPPPPPPPPGPPAPIRSHSPKKAGVATKSPAQSFQRSALLSSIESFSKQGLKKVNTVDKSGPVLGKDPTVKELNIHDEARQKAKEQNVTASLRTQAQRSSPPMKPSSPPQMPQRSQQRLSPANSPTTRPLHAAPSQQAMPYSHQRTPSRQAAPALPTSSPTRSPQQQHQAASPRTSPTMAPAPAPRNAMYATMNPTMTMNRTSAAPLTMNTNSSAAASNSPRTAGMQMPVHNTMMNATVRAAPQRVPQYTAQRYATMNPNNYSAQPPLSAPAATVAPQRMNAGTMMNATITATQRGAPPPPPPPPQRVPMYSPGKR